MPFNLMSKHGVKMFDKCTIILQVKIYSYIKCHYYIYQFQSVPTICTHGDIILYKTHSYFCMCVLSNRVIRFHKSLQIIEELEPEIVVISYIIKFYK